MKIGIFYHCLFYHGNPPTLRGGAVDIVCRQMEQLYESGLSERADFFLAGVNGPIEESREMARMFIPQKAKLVFHGPDSFAENLTIVELERWAKSNPGWAVLYFHAKGCTHDPATGYAQMSGQWREGMSADLIANWRHCVSDLEAGWEIVCSHWMWNMADGTQHIPAGNFLWVNSSFVARLPSIFLRDRIKQDGIAAASSRYEAEVYWGNGPRPNVKSYRPNGGGGVP